jgi:two-component system chemotaxis response regulator CheY
VAKILIADDAAFMRMRCGKMLQSHGHTVVEAENGREAVEKFTTEAVDVVLLDITMPEMDGLTALKEIRKIDPGARVAMVTAIGQQQVVMEALQSGARDFVVKPFQPERVLAAVEKLLK